MLKKLSTILLALMLVAGLALMGCGNGTTDRDDEVERVLPLGLTDSGDPIITRVGNYIQVSGRANNWYGIDTALNELEDAIDPAVTYTVTVTGSVAAATTMQLQRPFDADPWNAVLASDAVAAAGGTFTLTFDVLGSTMNGTAFTGDGGSAANGRLRVTAQQADVNFTIQSFVLVGGGETITLLPFGEGGNGTPTASSEAWDNMIENGSVNAHNQGSGLWS